MKKIFLATLLLVFIATSYAQINIGVKAGLNRYALTGDDKSYKNGLHIGAFAQIPITELLVVQPELLFSAEGNEFEENDIKFGQYLNYVNIPVMLRVNTKGGFYAEAGPQFGFLLSAKYKETGSPSEDIKKFFKGSNLSIGAGFGYQFKMGLGVGARYNFGLANIYSENNFETKSTGGQLSISYIFIDSKKSNRKQ